MDLGAETRRIVIPYEPRAQFVPFHLSTKRWSIIVAHRRAGKTVAEINKLVRRALECPLHEPRFAYAAPFYSQAKDVAWNYLKRFTAPIPGATPHESELRVDLPTGARVRLYGLDNYDRLRGGYLDGIVLDEYGDSDPRAWQEVIRPALSDRQGWADFIGTPKGRNHFFDLWDRAQQDETWFARMLKASETGLLPQEELDDAAKAMSAEQYAAEYECSFAAGVVGAYYGRDMETAESEGRITAVPWITQLPVHTAWDLGRRDLTTIWFFQLPGGNRGPIHLIDYLENNGVHISWYAKQLHAKPYVYGRHCLPHDADSEHLAAEHTISGQLSTAGLRDHLLLERTDNLNQDINLTRTILPRCRFDREKCDRGIRALRDYRQHWDDKRKAFNDHPYRDWTTHGADAARAMAVAISEGLDNPGRSAPRPPRNPNRSWMTA